jgi:hypothetical protein
MRSRGSNSPTLHRSSYRKDEDHADYLRHGVVELGVSRDATNTLREISTNDAIFPEAL